MNNRLWKIAVCGLGLMAPLSACTVSHSSAVHTSSVEDDDDRAEFIGTLNRATSSIDGFVTDTSSGRNLSDFTLGLFVSNLLGILGERDPTLSEYLHRGNRFIQDYLTDIFQYHADEEIASLDRQAESDNSPYAAAASRALEVLRHIPDGRTPSEQQAEERSALIEALTGLKEALEDIRHSVDLNPA